jgi:hypothetical protein
MEYVVGYMGRVVLRKGGRKWEWKERKGKEAEGKEKNEVKGKAKAI